MSKKTIDYNSKNDDYGTARIDPFYYDQPPLEFVDELKKPYHEKKPKDFGIRACREGEISVGGIFIDQGDFANNELLETAFSTNLIFNKNYCAPYSLCIGGSDYRFGFTDLNFKAFMGIRVDFPQYYGIR